MNSQSSLFLFLKFSSLLLLVLCSASCLDTKVSRDSSAGPNLGFEFSHNGLPANWILYDPPQFDYSISLDTSNPMEGKQSLRFDVRKSPEEGRVNYTGFTNEFPDLTKAGGRYRLSFWIKNKGLHYRIYAGGTKAKESDGNPLILEDSATFTEWKKMEFETRIPVDMWLRFEIQLKGEGTFQIDQVEIKKLSSVS
jgi:hypothetical protein